jgi:translation initiation factor IF-2
LSVRIYALAKDLDIDSKELVDICTRAGIPGKGSALASLTEDEVAKLKSFMDKSAAKPAAKPGKVGPPSPPPLERPKAPPRSDRKLQVITTPKSSSPLTSLRKQREDEDEPTEAPGEAAELAPESTPEAKETTPVDVPSSPETAASEPPAAETQGGTRGGGSVISRMMRREDYIGPGGGGRKMPVVGGKRDKDAGKAKPRDNQPKARPAIKLAPLPAAPEKPAPKAKKKADEGPALKPDMKLPAEILNTGKLGSKPLADHLRRAERKLAEDKIVEEKPTKGGKGRKSKGPSETTDGEDRPMLGGREQRQASRNRRPRRQDEDGGGSSPRRMFRRQKRSGVNTAAPRKDRVQLELPCTVKEFSEAVGVPAAAILRILMSEGVLAQMNAVMDPELAEFVAAELDVNVEFIEPQTLEDQLLTEIREREDDPSEMIERPPVITFLGHVDHGKTSLLDRIIGSNVVSGESGGITQHIRAYQIDKDGRRIAFVDTPGHEAFTSMRARGANVTDIAVLVVAADDGVMPQTEEAIGHARAAGVPIVVALNKMDLPGADENRAMQSLAANNLLPTAWGGDVEVVKTSAATGDGIDELLETLLTVAELHEYRANPNRPALGTALESQQDPDQGVITKLIVQNGTLRVGDVVVCGEAFGRVKAMSDPLGTAQRVNSAGPSTPVNVIGFESPPGAGESFYVLDDISQAREIAEIRREASRSQQLNARTPVHVTLESLFDRLDSADDVQTLNLILRADVRGSIEAIQKELTKLDHPEVKLRTLLATVGGVTEGDVHLAHASDAVIIAFNVVPDDRARSLAEQLGVQIRRYDIIYKIGDDLKAAMEGMLKPEQREVELGRALIQQLYKISRLGTIAGCRVVSGTVERNARSRIIRESTIIGDYPIDTLRREKDDVKEVREGYECGIKLAGYNDIKEGDLLEVYRMEEVARSFDD